MDDDAAAGGGEGDRGSGREEEVAVAVAAGGGGALKLRMVSSDSKSNMSIDTFLWLMMVGGFFKDANVDTKKRRFNRGLKNVVSLLISFVNIFV